MLLMIYIVILIVMFVALGMYIISTINAPEQTHDDRDSHGTTHESHGESVESKSHTEISVEETQAILQIEEAHEEAVEETQAAETTPPTPTLEISTTQTNEVSMAEETNATQTPPEEVIVEKTEDTLNEEPVIDAPVIETPPPTRLLLNAPRNDQKDNLTLIKGVGIKLEEKLNELGIFHFDQIAGWSQEDIDWVDSSLSFSGRIQRDSWVDQSKILATGGSTEFSQRVAKGEVTSSHQ